MNTIFVSLICALSLITCLVAGLLGYQDLGLGALMVFALTALYLVLSMTKVVNQDRKERALEHEKDFESLIFTEFEWVSYLHFRRRDLARRAGIITLLSLPLLFVAYLALRSTPYKNWNLGIGLVLVGLCLIPSWVPLIQILIPLNPIPRNLEISPFGHRLEGIFHPWFDLEFASQSLKDLEFKPYDDQIWILTLFYKSSSFGMRGLNLRETSIPFPKTSLAFAEKAIAHLKTAK